MKKIIKIFVLLICAFLCAYKVKAEDTNYTEGIIISNNSVCTGTNCVYANNSNMIIIQARLYYLNVSDFENIGKTYYFVNTNAYNYLKNYNLNLIEITNFNSYNGDNRYTQAINYINTYLNNETNGKDMLNKLTGFNDYTSVLIKDIVTEVGKTQGYRILLEPALVVSNVNNKTNTAIFTIKGVASKDTTALSTKLGTYYNQAIKVFDNNVSDSNKKLFNGTEATCKTYNNQTLADYKIKCLYKMYNVDNYISKNGNYICYRKTVDISNGGMTCTNWDKNNEETYTEKYTSYSCKTTISERKLNNIYGKKIIEETGTCKLYCKEKLELSFPGNISMPKQKGTYFAWPTTTEGSNYKLIVKTTLDCTIVDDGGITTTAATMSRICTNGTYHPDNPNLCISNQTYSKVCPDNTREVKVNNNSYCYVLSNPTGNTKNYVTKSTQCPYGYTPTGQTGNKACVKQIEQYSSKKCNATNEVEASKFTLGNDGKCSATYGKPNICPSGFTYYSDTQTCAKVGVNIGCPPNYGYNPAMGTCVKTTSSNNGCPNADDTNFFGLVCISKEKLKCENFGNVQDLGNKTCRHYISGSCPQNYTYDKQTQKCVRQSNSCDSNYWYYAADTDPMSNSSCYYTNSYGKQQKKYGCRTFSAACYTAHSDAIYVDNMNAFCHTNQYHAYDNKNTCPSGCYYKKYTNGCNTSSKTQDPTCPPGTTLLRDASSNEPMCYVDKSKVCPYGYTNEGRSDDACIASIINSCPPEYMSNDSGVCFTTANPDYCPEGYSNTGRNDNKCVAYSAASCPPGYSTEGRNDGICVAYSTATCDTNNGYTPTGLSGSRACKKYVSDYKPKTCINNTSENYTKYSETECRMTVTPYCENGSEVVNGKCCVGNTVVDKVNNTKTGKCRSTTQTQNKVCPYDDPNKQYYTENSTSSICRLISTNNNIVYTCPSGFTLNGTTCINNCTSEVKEKFKSRIEEKLNNPQFSAYLKVDSSNRKINDKLETYNVKTTLLNSTRENGQLKGFKIENTYNVRMNESINRFYNKLTGEVSDSNRTGYFDRGEGVISLNRNSKTFGLNNTINNYYLEINNFKNIGIDTTFDNILNNSGYVCQYRITDKSNCKCPIGTKNDGDSVYNISAYINNQNPKVEASNADVTYSCIELQEKYCNYEIQQEYCKKDSEEKVNITDCIKNKNTTYEEAYKICEKENCNPGNNYCTKNCVYIDKKINNTVYTIQKCNNSTEICGFYLHCIEDKETSQSYLDLVSQRLNTTNIVKSLRNGLNIENIESAIRGLDSSICGIKNNPKIVYREIDLNNPFPGKEGTSRDAGYNWKSDTIINEKITNNRGVTANQIYNKEPIYTITLTPQVIKEIRKYNDNNKYNDLLKCSDNVCISSFIHGNDNSLKTMGVLNGINNCTSLNTSSNLSSFDSCYNIDN